VGRDGLASSPKPERSPVLLGTIALSPVQRRPAGERFGDEALVSDQAEPDKCLSRQAIMRRSVD